jgi:hypothetical protein
LPDDVDLSGAVDDGGDNGGCCNNTKDEANIKGSSTKKRRPKMRGLVKNKQGALIVSLVHCIEIADRL